MIEVQENPLVTFAVIAYNQEDYIREAVEGAFRQTYRPLEIILSDDCSKDSTFEIMKEMVASYRGPHRVFLHRNVANAGLNQHLNLVMERSQGLFFVVAAGDDVSYPSRAEVLARTWLDNPGCFYVYSDFDELRGNTISRNPPGCRQHCLKVDEMIEKAILGIPGCSAAWARDVWSRFGPLPDEFVPEDVVLPFRAALLGEIRHVDQSLLLYRKHAASLWQSFVRGRRGKFSDHRDFLVRMVELRQRVWQCYHNELVRAVELGLVSPEASTLPLSRIAFHLETARLLRIYYCGSYRARIAVATKLLARESPFWPTWRARLMNTLVYGPMPFLKRLAYLRHVARDRIRLRSSKP
jgi:glycosyltransferase involved in cell wall biosynthesis